MTKQNRTRSAFLSIAFLTAALHPIQRAWASPADTKEAGEAAKKLYAFGKDPSAESLLDGAVTAMTMGYPPLGAAFGAMKSMMGMLGWFSKPDPVAEALAQLGARLEALEGRVERLDSEIRRVESQQFRDQNLARMRELLRRHDDLEGLVYDLGQRPADPQLLRSLANRGRILADSFLLSRDVDLWLWSDLDRKTAEILPPDFKPLPTFEYYASALVFWMAALEAAAERDPTWVVQTHAEHLRRHVAFLSVRAGWNERSDGAQTLPEQIQTRVHCRFEPDGRVGASGTYSDPETGLCGARVWCDDRLARRERMIAGNYEYPHPAGSLCTLPANHRKPVEEEIIEEFYGLPVMQRLATTLERVATTGRASVFNGQFERALASEQFLYLVRADGITVWLKHTMIDRPSAPAPEIHERRLDPNAPPPIAGPDRRGAQTPTAGSLHVSAAAITALQRPPAPTVEHRLSAPVPLDAQGWNELRALIPAGGGSFYTVAADGTGRWQHHGGWQTGGATLSEPVTLSGDLGRFRRLFGGGDGVIYGIDDAGVLHWRRTDGDQSTPPRRTLVAGPPVNTAYWGHFIHVFSGGEGWIYAVQPGGDLYRYRHLGYREGSLSWQREEKVGSGWNVFSHVFSPGGGNVYGLRPDGALFWYRDIGYATGTAAWIGPVELSSGWTDVVHATARIWGATQPPVVR